MFAVLTICHISYILFSENIHNERKNMNIRIWSKKIVAVLYHYRSNPHIILFGVTGDLDNLGVYVARNGRARAEILVDSYNRIIGSIFYQFIGQHPHMFHESNFLPAGEEVFILGTCANTQIAEELFRHLKGVSIPKLLVEAGLDAEATITDVSFGCCILNFMIDTELIDDILTRIDNGDVVGANRSYIITMQQIRSILATQLDLEKFSDISQDEQIAVLLRNIIYAKTLQYKESTKDLLFKLGKKIVVDKELQNRCVALLGSEYGLRGRDQRRILTELEEM